MGGDPLICRKCVQKKTVTDFYKNGKQGRLRTCIDCRRESANAKHRRFYLVHIEKRRQKSRADYQSNMPYYRKLNKQWFTNNPERARELWARKYQDPVQRVSFNVSRRIRECIKSGKNGRHWESIVGFSLSQLKSHLEKRFIKGMSWDNYGEWHIDHIIPVSFFQYNSFKDVEFRMCWRLDNLQPLWAIDNIRKGNKVRRVS